MVRAELASRGVGIPWLAEATGIPARTLRSILGGGQATVKLWHVCAVADALGVRCGVLVGRVERLGHGR